MAPSSRRTTLGALATALFPPALVELAGRYRRTGNLWSGDYGSWAEAASASAGYDATGILEKVEAAALRVHRGEAAYERDSVVFDEVTYSWPLLAALMWIAARNGGRLDVLDFGGALGSSYRQNRAFLAPLQHVRWSVVEQPHFVQSGKRLFEDDQLRFYDSIDACLLENAPQVVMLSSVLQYLERPHELLQSLAVRFPFLVLDLTPMHEGPDDRLTVQDVPPSIYTARYPCWIFSEERLLRELKNRFRVISAFDSHLGQSLRIDKTRAKYRGLILERIGSE